MFSSGKLFVNLESQLLTEVACRMGESVKRESVKLGDQMR